MTVQEAKDNETRHTEMDRYLEAYPLEKLDPRVRDEFRTIFREYAAVSEGLMSIPSNALYKAIIPGTDSYGQEVYHMARNNVLRGNALQGIPVFPLPVEWQSPSVTGYPPPSNKRLADMLFETTALLYRPFKLYESGKVPDIMTRTVQWFTDEQTLGYVTAQSVIFQAAVHAGRHGGIGLIEAIAHKQIRPNQDHKNWG